MDNQTENQISFVRLTDIHPDEILTHMSDPLVAKHMPLLTHQWTLESVAQFIAAKEACWQRDGLGHWAILYNGAYVGWGGFQKEGDEWDYGLVLKPEYFGLGLRISRKTIEFAKVDGRIPFVTFLLPPSRKNLGAFKRFGAEFIGEIDYEGNRFLKFRLDF